MNKFAQAILGTAVVLALAACGNKEEQTAAAPEATPAMPVAPVPALPVPISYRDTVALTVVTDKYRTQVGQLQGPLLVSNGKPGYLLFGPYTPVQAGTYTLNLKGSANSLPADAKVIIDMASDKGRVIHGSQQVTATGPLPSFDVTLPENVADLEVRVQVSKDAKIAVESYQLVKKP